MKNSILILIAVFVMLLSFYFGSKVGDLGGADDKAGQVITQVAPEYKPYFKNIFEPSQETESLLFALQAAGGAFIIGYILGRKKNDKGNNIILEKQQSKDHTSTT